MRHWKQHWDPASPLQFARRMNLGIEGFEHVNVGDPVTDEIRAAMGKNADHRLKVWFQAGYVEIANWSPPKAEPRRPELQGGPGGWFTFETPDGGSCRVRGRARAESALAEAWA